MRLEAYTIMEAASRKRMQIYKYKIRHESEYLLKMRKQIMTNYRSTRELSPFLLRFHQAIYQKC